MNDLITTTEPTMSTVDLLDIISHARHISGDRPIRYNDFMNRVSDELDGEYYETFVVQNPNKTESMAAMLTRDQCFLVAMRESKTVRRYVLDRLKQLEAEQAPRVALPDFSDPVAAARAWADAEEAKQRAVASLEAARPAVEFADRVALADKGVKIGNFAKTIGMGPRKIFGILRDLRILMTGGERHNLPYQQYIDRGYFSVRQGTYEANGETRIGHTPLVTGKGERWLHERLQGEGYIPAALH